MVASIFSTQMFGTSAFLAIVAPNIFLDPSDTTSLYQNRVGGTSFATAANDPIGIILDKSQMGGRTAAAFIASQPGVFSDAAATMTGETTRISPNVYRVYSSAGAFSAVSLIGGLTVGSWYQITFNVDSITTLGAGVVVNNTSISVTTTGAESFVFRAVDADDVIKRGAGPTDIQVSNISIKAIPGYHGIAPTDGARPRLQFSAGGKNVARFDGTDDRWDFPGALGLFQNVGGGILAAGHHWRTAPVVNETVLFASNGVSGGQARAALMAGVSNNWQAGGRRLDADSFMNVQSSGAATLTTPSIHYGEFNWTNSDLTQYINNVVDGLNTTFQTNGSTENTASLGFSVGGYPSGGNNADIDLYALVVKAGTNTILTATNRSLINIILRQRAGI